MRGRALNLKTGITVFVKCTVIIGLLCLPSLLVAQTRGKVEVVKDPKVDSLIGNYLVGGKNNTVEPSSSGTYGFRIQIYSGDERKDAYIAQAKFQHKYPEVRTYLSYRAPNFKVKVGDYRSRLEAEKMMQQLDASFDGLFIIAEKINPPILDTE